MFRGHWDTPRVTVHRQRAARGWSYWQGSPGDIANIASEASELVGPRDNRELKITVRAKTWQYDYPTVEEFLEDIRPDELADVMGMTVTAVNTGAGREVTVTFKRTSQATGDTVIVSIVGGEREWTESAEEKIGELVSSRSNRGAVPWWVAGIGFFVGFGAYVVASRYDNPIRAIAIVCAALCGVAFIVATVDSVITPVFEFTPDGQDRRRRALHLGRRGGSWLADRVASGAIEFLLGVLVTVVYFHYLK